MSKSLALALVVMAALVVGCTSGDGLAECELDGGTVLADSAWPKFRRDRTNSGRTDVDLGKSPRRLDQLFPLPDSTMSIGPIASTPILGLDRIFLASSDGTVYVLDFEGQEVSSLEEDIAPGDVITGSPLLGEDGTLFVGAGDGTIRQYHSDGTEKNNFQLGGFISAPLNIGADGTVYGANLTGSFAAVCPNGIARFVLSVARIESSVAVSTDPETLIILAAGSLVRAVDIDGRQRWSFSATSQIAAAVVLDEPSDRFFVADRAGRVFAGNISDGQRRPEFHFETETATENEIGSMISASPALGRDDRTPPVIYVADRKGTLYALSRETGAVQWTFEAGGTIQSSPAVATGGNTDDVIVFGADDGFVYAVADRGSDAAVVWMLDTGAPIGRASPSIGEDGTVYIGTEGAAGGGALYAITVE